MEIIVVDNGSEDGSQEAVRTEFPSVKLIENEANLGFAKANNIGIRAAKGRYVCVVNSDVRVMEGCIDALTDFMNLHPSVGLCGPQILWPDMSIQDSCRRFPSLWNNFCSGFKLDKLFPHSPVFSGEHMFYFAHNEQMKVDSLAGCFLMIRRESLDRVGLFDERYFIYAEEVDLCKRFRNSIWEVVFYPDAKAVHHHAASSSRDPIRFALEQQRSILKYWRKHHSAAIHLGFAVILALRCLTRAISGVLLYWLLPSKRVDLEVRIRENATLLADLFSNRTGACANV
jgi:GT2 family glycosyltransferase